MFYKNKYFIDKIIFLFYTIINIVLGLSFLKYIKFICLCFLFCFNPVMAEYYNFIAVERSTASKHINDIINNKTKNFLSIEDKLYIEYNFDNNFIIDGYLKHNKSISYNDGMKILSRNNYFYNIGFKQNIYKKNLFFLFNFGKAINIDNNFVLMNNSDIYTNYQLGFMLKMPFYNNMIKSELIYNYYHNAFKDDLNYTLYYEMKKNLTSLFIISYEWQYDFIKNSNNFKYKNRMKYDDLHKYLSRLHTFSLNSIFALNDDYSASFKYSFNIDDKYGETFHSFSIAFWF